MVPQCLPEAGPGCWGAVDKGRGQPLSLSGMSFRGGQVKPRSEGPREKLRFGGSS